MLGVLAVLGVIEAFSIWSMVGASNRRSPVKASRPLNAGSESSARCSLRNTTGAEVVHAPGEAGIQAWIADQFLKRRFRVDIGNHRIGGGFPASRVTPAARRPHLDQGDPASQQSHRATCRVRKGRRHQYARQRRPVLPNSHRYAVQVPVNGIGRAGP